MRLGLKQKKLVFIMVCVQSCGVNHQSMPIEIHVVTQEKFDIWVEEARTELSKNNKFANK